MKLKNYQWIFYLTTFYFFSGLTFCFAGEKITGQQKKGAMSKPAGLNEAVIDIGSVQNYFWNNTTDYFGNEKYGFMIGDAALINPSMQWLEGGYPLNHYLYFAVTKICIDNGLVRFNSLTSNDWQVTVNDPQAVSPYEIVFSFTDELAGTLRKGIKTCQTVHAWPESYRDDFFILEYDIINTGSSQYQDCYLIFHVDADVSAANPDIDYYLDDLTSYYIGRDTDGNDEYISYMYDADSKNIPGDDTGGGWIPKESLGYIGSRVLECPPRTGEGPETANTQSGHQWWDWNNDPTGDTFYVLAQQQTFKSDPGTPHDYRYLQCVGPFVLNPGDTNHVALAFGIGEGLDGLRQNLLWASRLYWNNFVGPAAPEPPQCSVESGDRWVRISWDGERSEQSRDPVSGELDFEGYRLFRSPDKLNWTLLASYDVIDRVLDNTGLPIKNADGLYEYLDQDVSNGFGYYYAVTAFDRGSSDLASLETGKQTDLYAYPGVSLTGSVSDREKICVVPNPFIVKAPWDYRPTVDNPSEERLQFQNIPFGSKITIFNLAGDMIIELYQKGDQGWVDWDLISRNRQKVVSGLYLYVVEPQEGENFIGKFVIVR